MPIEGFVNHRIWKYTIMMFMLSYTKMGKITSTDESY